jgi:hypothetical protein
MQWRAHFRESVSRERDFDWDSEISLSPEIREPVITALQHVQRALSSPGLNLRTKVRFSCSPEYADCIDLYVKEKGVHADLLARLLWELGEQPSKRFWADFAFRRFRRRFGWTGELMVLLTAEMAAVPLFRVMANHIDDPVIKAVLESILEDEAFHLGFHIDHLRPELHKMSNLGNVAMQHAWGALFSTTLTYLMTDLRDLFRTFGYSRLTFWTDAWNLFAQVQTGLNGSEHLNALISRDPRLKFAL